MNCNDMGRSIPLYFYGELPPDDNSPKRVNEVRGLLETGLADAGFDAETSGQRLAGFLAVQNTYLSTFQSLGAQVPEALEAIVRRMLAKRLQDRYPTMREFLKDMQNFAKEHGGGSFRPWS